MSVEAGVDVRVGVRVGVGVRVDVRVGVTVEVAVDVAGVTTLGSGKSSGNVQYVLGGDVCAWANVNSCSKLMARSVAAPIKRKTKKRVNMDYLFLFGLFHNLRG